MNTMRHYFIVNMFSARAAEISMNVVDENENAKTSSSDIDYHLCRSWHSKVRLKKRGSPETIAHLKVL